MEILKIHLNCMRNNPDAHDPYPCHTDSSLPTYTCDITENAYDQLTEGEKAWEWLFYRQFCTVFLHYVKVNDFAQQPHLEGTSLEGSDKGKSFQWTEFQSLPGCSFSLEGAMARVAGLW